MNVNETLSLSNPAKCMNRIAGNLESVFCYKKVSV